MRDLKTFCTDRARSGIFTVLWKHLFGLQSLLLFVRRNFMLILITSEIKLQHSAAQKVVPLKSSKERTNGDVNLDAMLKQNLLLAKTGDEYGLKEKACVVNTTLLSAAEHKIYNFKKGYTGLIEVLSDQILIACTRIEGFTSRLSDIEAKSTGES